MLNASAVAVFGPFGNEETVTALGAFDDRARSRKFSGIAKKFHRAFLQHGVAPYPIRLVRHLIVVRATLKQQA